MTVRLNRDEVRRVLTSRDGPVAGLLLQRAVRVEDRAAMNLTRGATRAIDTGRLRASLAHELVSQSGGLVARVGTNVQYALYVHEGTGIYGPKRMPIRPKSRRALAFQWKRAPVPPNGKGGRHVYRSVKGSPPRPFLRQALNEVMNGSQITEPFR